MEPQLPPESEQPKQPKKPMPQDDPLAPFIERLCKDLKASAKLLGRHQVRFIVDTYYALQRVRIAAGSQSETLVKGKEPDDLVSWFALQMERLEKQIPKAMEVWVKAQPDGEWLLSICGIGPVIAAGLLAHIDIEPWRCRNKTAKKSCKEAAPCTPQCGKEILHTAGHIWSFAGIYGPKQEWFPKTKRPWNASLKTLCWKLGESFVMVSNNAKDIYGHVYAERKKLEEKRNAEGLFVDQAKAKLEKFKISKDTDAYAAYIQGKLPSAHLHARAKRYAVKRFLAHFHEHLYVTKYGKRPPLPYPIAIMGHPEEHYIPPPQ